MARTIIPTVITSPGTGAGIGGVSVVITKQSDGSYPPTYPNHASASNGTGQTGITTDQYGRVTRAGALLYIDPGTYILSLSGSGLTGTQLEREYVSGVADDAAGSASLRTLGAGAQQAAAGNDARLSDQRTPPDASVTFVKFAVGVVGSGGSTIAAGNDARLSDQRTPLAASVTLAKLAQFGNISWQAGGNNLQAASYQDQPTLGPGALITAFGPLFTFPTAGVSVIGVTTRWFNNVGRTVYVSTGGAWVHYFVSGTGVLADYYNPNGITLYPVSELTAIGY